MKYRLLSVGAVALAAAVVLPSCDNTGLPPDLTIRLTTEVEAWTMNLADPPFVECAIYVTADATGERGAEARWEDATIEIFGGPDRTNPVAELNFPADEIRAWFGAATIDPGSRQEMSWNLTAPLPFQGHLMQRFRVEPSGEIRTTEAYFDCGPVVGSGAPPAAELNDVSPSTPEPGSEATIQYQITSQVGLWAVSVELSTGGWSAVLDRVVEVGATTTSETIQTTLPWDVPTGAPLTVTLIATDLAGQTADATIQTVDVVQDRSPPSLHVDTPCDSDCRIAAGGTLRLTGWIGDASEHHLIYTLGDPAFLVDSVAFTPGGHDYAVEVPIEPPSAGWHPLSLRVVDSNGYTSPDSLVAQLDVYPGMAMDVEQVEIQGLVTDVRIDELRGVVYAARPVVGDLVVLSLADLRQVTTIPVNGGPYSVDLSLSGDSLLVALADGMAIAVLQADHYEPLGVVSLSALEGGFRPLSIRVAQNGRWLVHAERLVEDQPGVADVALLELRPSQGEQVLLESGRREAWGRLIPSDDRARIASAVECLRVYDGGTGARSECGAGSIRELATDRSGSFFADTGQLLTSDLQRVSTWYPLSGYANAVELTPDGTHLLVAMPDYLDVVPTSENALPVLRLWGASPSGRLEVSPSGNVGVAWGSIDLLPAFNEDSTPVARIDLQPVVELP